MQFGDTSHRTGRDKVPHNCQDQQLKQLSLPAVAMLCVDGVTKMLTSRQLLAVDQALYYTTPHQLHTVTSNNNNNNRHWLWCCHQDKVIVRVHLVHLMNVEQCQVAANPQTKLIDFGCESTSRLVKLGTVIRIHPGSSYISFKHKYFTA